MRKLASVARILSIEPIQDSDRLSVATMDGKGWRVVVGRGDFNPGDLAVYFEIDSFLPVDDPRYEFLKERCTRVIKAKDGTLLDSGIRIRTVRLRGVLSQGLLIPLSKFPEIEDRSMQVNAETMFRNQDGTLVPFVGADVTDILHVRHFDEVCERYADLVDPGRLSGESFGKFPSYVPVTDEERIQNLTHLFDEARGRRFEVTVKADGTSLTMMYVPTMDPDRPFKVCSRNNDLKRTDRNGNVLLQWKIAEQYDVEGKLKKLYEETGRNLAFQGELVGIGIQKNRNRLNGNDWLVFRVYDVERGEFLPPDERRRLCADLGLHHVEVVDESMDVFGRFRGVDELLCFAEGKTAEGNEREGLVFKSCDGGPHLSFKAVSNRYLLKQEC